MFIMSNYTDLEIVQMRGQCNRVRLGMSPDNDHARYNAAKMKLMDINPLTGRYYLTKDGEKFCFDLSGKLPI